MKNKNKNKNKNKVSKSSSYFCFGAAANERHFRLFFFNGPPCDAGRTRPLQEARRVPVLP
jgi:hypothetical protein